MGDAVSLFVAGLGGVFAGMALLYLAIRVTAAVADRYFQDAAKPGSGSDSGAGSGSGSESRPGSAAGSNPGGPAA